MAFVFHYYMEQKRAGDALPDEKSSNRWSVAVELFVHVLKYLVD
jgi:hypothetical protein